MGNKMIPAMVAAILSFLPLLAHEKGFPEKTLRQIFPEAQSFAVRNRNLTQDELLKLRQMGAGQEEAANAKLQFYVAVGKTDSGTPRSLGAVFILHGYTASGLIDMAVGLNSDQSIKGIVVTENAADPAVGQEKFLSQFVGKKPGDPLQLGQDLQFDGDQEAATAVIQAARRGMYLLGTVLKA